ncbi:glycosyltransferase [Devosia sp. Leaf64]|uniref:glycosyltransferase n=1 Tax=Devosia sp. Leaf64 TaxID=1736229 RepID=UPI000712D37C|nr:glycosyltransferase [Devosia sp. Leaf64]KQN74789.1 histidine kinase [Devosia sp. Leaf64]
MLLATAALLTFIFAILLVYPYIIYPRVLQYFPRKPIVTRPVNAGNGSQFSLLFCAYNEAASLPAKIENLNKLKSQYPGIEVLAFDDGSSDGTAEMIEQGAPFVRLIKGAGRSGKARGMKTLAPLATGEYLVFTDANVLLDDNALDALAIAYTDNSVGGVCGALHYLGADGTVTASVGGLYWRIEEKIKDLESSTGSVMGADGSIFSIRKNLYPEFPDTVLDDFTVSMEVVFRGKRLIKDNDVVAYEKLVSARADEFNRKIRIAARAYHTHQILRNKLRKLDKLDRFKYLSHKLIRWFGGAFFVAGALSGITMMFAADQFSGWISIGILAACLLIGSSNKIRVLSSAFEILLAMFATLIGVTKAIQGKTFVTWRPAKSR